MKKCSTFAPFFGIFILLVGSSIALQAQSPSDTVPPLRLWMQFSASATPKDTPMPHYHYFSQGGRWNEADLQALTQFGGDYEGTWAQLKWQAGVEGYLRANTNNRRGYIQQAYFLLHYWKLQVVAGQLNENKLFRAHAVPASGDMGMSDNAPPLPRIGLMFSDYVQVPFLGDWVFVHGLVHHGWFTEDRFIRSPYLHQKQLHFRIGGPHKLFSAQGGLRHYAMWGGKVRPGSKGVAPLAEASLLTLLKVAIGQEMPQTAPPDRATGNYLGIWDLNLAYHGPFVDIMLYGQKFFEDNSSFPPWKLPLDGTFGLYFAPKGIIFWLKDIRLEFMTNIHQGGHGIPDPTDEIPETATNFDHPFGGRDNNYNHSVYRSGYTHRNFLMGPAFLTTKARVQALGIPVDISDPLHEVLNSRVQAWTISAQFQLTRRSNLRVDLSQTTNYGTYFGLYGGRFKWAGIKTPAYEYYFAPPKHQTYTRVAGDYEFFDRWTALLSVAIDVGEIYNSVGVQAGVRYQFELKN